MANRVNRLLFKETAQWLDGEHNVVLIGYRGLSAGDAATVRRAVSDQGLVLRVVRNRITLRALSELGRPDLTALFDGPTAVMDGGEDPIGVAKAAVAFEKRHPALEIRGGLIEGEVCERDGVVTWSNMPSREELLGMIVWQVACVAGRVIAAVTGPGGQVASQLEKMGEKDEAA